MRTAKEVKQWLMALEAERHDTSWRKPLERSYQPEVIYRDRPVDNRYRDSIMFHAGRYAAGARDLDAARANRVVGKMIKDNK